MIYRVSVRHESARCFDEVDCRSNLLESARSASVPILTEKRITACCCGLYVERGSGGGKRHYCPTGKRLLCGECVGKGSECPTHGVPIRVLAEL